MPDNNPLAQSTRDQNFSSNESTVSCKEDIVSNAVSVVGAVGIVCAVSPSTIYERQMHVQQLLVLLHAYKCQMYETRTNGEVRICSFPDCSRFKQVLAHMATCHARKFCPVPYCISSNRLISHWINCTQSDCPLCVSLKKAAAVAAQTSQTNNPVYIQTAYASLGHPCKTGGDAGNFNAMLQRGQAVPVPNVNVQEPHCSSQSISHIRALQSFQQNKQRSRFQLQSVYQSNTTGVIPRSNAQHFLMNSVRTKNYSRIVAWLNTQNQVIPEMIDDNAGSSKDWRQFVSQAERQRVVQIVVKTIFPTFDVNAYRDHDMNTLVACSEKVENDVYNSANSKEEYYRLLAERTYSSILPIFDYRQKAKESQSQ